jgi:hypothetical protein
MKLGNLLARGAMALSAVALTAGTAAADPEIGGTLNKSGDIWARFIGHDAFYDDDLYFYINVGDLGTAQFLFTNHTSVPGTEVDVADGTLAIGDEAIFGICVDRSGGEDGTNNCADAEDFFYTGDPTRNADGQHHVKIWTIAAYIAEQPLDGESLAFAQAAADAGYTYILGFEDILGGGDEDYNDVVYALRGVTVVPEPVSMTLLATGLAGMGGFGALKRRRNK